ncbi:hypothetical protein LSH36_826g00020 [Paralvinella palmiformis]|uniref:Protein odr-4 homolog n=1 Tax=Paralvinella palmiformis TaxID=53620 RepID=A0AAD9MTT7_9ANNE|nr:hypothetical protein LSH36_826g00020 [Paralvinella palmiformis]
MGRTLIAEESLENNMSSLFNKDKWVIGVIIGQITEQRDYILHLATTPKMEHDDPDGFKVTKEETLDTVDESWIVTHAKQVTRMLPGGLDILGIFASAPPDVMKNIQAKLRQSAARPADWKYQRFADKMHRLETKLSVNCFIPVSNTSLSQSLQKQILHGIKPFCNKIQNSIATIDNQIAVGDEMLVPVQSGTGKKGRKHQEEQTGKNFQVQLFEVMNPIKKEDLGPPQLVKCGAKLSINGTVICVAFVHSKATKAEAIKALKVDVLRSLVSRCQLLCEDFLQTEEEQDTKVLYETPLRVFAPLGDSTVQLCDYMFPDETNNDVVDRFKELLNVTVPEDMLETDCETLPDSSEISEAETAEQKTERRRVFILGALAVLMAVLIAYLYQQDQKR